MEHLRPTLVIARLSQDIRANLESYPHGLAAAILLYDATMALTAMELAHLLSRADDPTYERQWLIALLAALPVTASFVAFAMQQRVWRHFALPDFIDLVKATAVGIGCSAVLLAATGAYTIRSSEAVLWWQLMLGMCAGGRIMWRWLVARARGPAGEGEAARSVLLVGTGAECSLFLRGISNGCAGNLRPVGILDDRGADIGRSINGVPVIGPLGGLDQAVDVLRSNGRCPEQVVVTRSIPPRALLELVENSDQLGMSTAELPSLGELREALVSGDLNLGPIKLEGLLGRSPVDLDVKAIEGLVRDRRVLVSGAGGSIGSELVRLVAGWGPAGLTLIDNCEFNLYRTEQILAEAPGDSLRTLCLADIRDPGRLRRIFADAHPQIVLHAAAFKHVPMLESNACEGVLANVVGTRNVAEAALSVGADAMVQVSTDKAVNPSSVMGATKRLAELYCQALDLGTATSSGSTRFMTVRFGNVLGSSGSVVPLFEKQILAGGPVTVTHPEMKRYFMTVPEACGLVLQAAAHGVREQRERGLIYVLDMGEPLRIVDIARHMVRLHGKRPDVDVEIAYVGLRPGEKLVEELFDRAESRVHAVAKGVLAAHSAPLPLGDLRRIVSHLHRLAESGDELRLRESLAASVPGFSGVESPPKRQAAA